MTEFELGARPLISVVLRKDVELASGDLVQLAVYAPGTVCSAWAEHHARTRGLNYGFLVWMLGQWSLLGSTCLTCRAHFAQCRTGRWQTALDNRHPLAGAGLKADWRDQTLRDYWRLVPLMGLILQLEPDHGLLRGYLGRATRRGRRPFTKAEWQTLLEILRERDGAFQAAEEEGPEWDRELAEHYKALKGRRDLAFRLGRLAALDLEPDDEKTVVSLRGKKGVFRRKGKRVVGLSRGQVKLVEALEARYFEQRREAARQMIETMVKHFELEPPED